MNPAWFDWDIGNRTKCQKHGLTIQDIEEVFSGKPTVAPDLKHSDAEPRLLAIGQTMAGRFAFVVFTMRNGKIRPLSARFMHAKEVRRYAKSS